MSQGDVVECESRGQASVEGAHMSVGEVGMNHRWVVLLLFIVAAAGCRPRTRAGCSVCCPSILAQNSRHKMHTCLFVPHQHNDIIGYNVN